MSKTIMVVDDEKMITTTLSMMIKMMLKINVAAFNDPLQALQSEELRQQKVDLIISDFMMPGMNGFDVAAVLKKVIKLRKNNLRLTDEGKSEILNLHDHVAGYISRVSLAVKSDSKDIMNFAHSEGTRIHALMKIYRKQHLERLAREQVNPLSSLVFTDILTDYRRMKDHVLNIAESQAGEK